MASLQTVLVSIATIVVLLVCYRFLFNPQVLPSGQGTICPDNWSFVGGLCQPQYETKCAAFDPVSITSAAQACNIARSCGTGWPGKCP
jgi:hypothetical protein